eukprot:2237379-Amphidinium_carterae.1
MSTSAPTAGRPLSAPHTHKKRALDAKKDVTLRTCELHNSSASSLFRNEESAKRAAKPTVDGRPLYGSKDASDENLHASWILRLSRRELVQSGLCARSLKVHAG